MEFFCSCVESRSMFVRAQKRILAVVAAAILAACGDGHDSKPKLDLVGKTARPGRGETSPAGSDARHPREVHEESFVVDLIQDIVFRKERDGWTLTTKNADVTVDKLTRGGFDLVLSALSGAPGKSSYGDLEKRFRIMEELAEATGGAVKLVTSLQQARTARSEGAAVPMMLLVEGADAFEGRIEQLETWRRRGLAVLGIVGGRKNAFADVAVAPSGGGLTDDGLELVEGCEELGILVDLTHASEKTFWDVLSRPTSRAIVTHSAARALRDHPRNLSDVQILGLKRRRSVMGLIFNPDFLTQGQGASIEDVIAHIMHFKRLGAFDALALGTDFDGVIPPRGLEDASLLPRLTELLASRGVSPRELSGLLGHNALRVLEAAQDRGRDAPAASADDLLRPVTISCDTATEALSGVAQDACDGNIITGTLVLKPLGQLKVRIRDASRSPVKLEVFGEPGVPWQLEGQNLEGRVLFHRSVALDSRGRAEIPLPSNRNLTRIFFSPSRKAQLGEVVVWGS